MAHSQNVTDIDLIVSSSLSPAWYLPILIPFIHYCQSSFYEFDCFIPL